jgi:hypothetical protein
MYFQYERKTLRSNETGKFQELVSKYSATILSFFGGKASNGGRKNSYLVGHGLPNHASGYELKAKNDYRRSLPAR